MKSEDLKPNKILRGPLFPEPVQVLIAIPVSSAVTLIGKLRSQQIEMGQALAPALSTPSSANAHDKGWVDIVLALKKGLGL